MLPYLSGLRMIFIKEVFIRASPGFLGVGPGEFTPGGWMKGLL